MDNTLPKDDSLPQNTPSSVPNFSAPAQDTNSNRQTPPAPPTPPEPMSAPIPEQPTAPSFEHTPPPPPPSWTSPMEVHTPTATPTPPSTPPPAASTSSLFLPDGHELNHHGPAPKLIIGMLLVAIILLGGGFFFMSQQQTQIKSETALIPTQFPTPTPNPTAGWLTYTDAKNGYSVKYPPIGAFETGKPYSGTNRVAETPAAFMTDGALLTILPNYKVGSFTPILSEPVMVGKLQTQKDFEASNSAFIQAVPVSASQTIAFSYKLPNDPQKAASINKLFDQILSTLTISSSESAMPGVSPTVVATSSAMLN